MDPPDGKLSPIETQDMLIACGLTVQPLCTALGELHFCCPPSESWEKAIDCAVCIANDSRRQAHFIQIFNVLNKSFYMEKEITIGFKYSKLEPLFYTFENEDNHAGLMFDDQEQALHVASVVRKVVIRMKLERKLRPCMPSSRPPLFVSPQPRAEPPMASPVNANDPPEEERPPMPKPRKSKAKPAADSDHASGDSSAPKPSKGVERSDSGRRMFSSLRKLCTADTGDSADSHSHGRCSLDDDVGDAGDTEAVRRREANEPPPLPNPRDKKSLQEEDTDDLGSESSASSRPMSMEKSEKEFSKKNPFSAVKKLFLTDNSNSTDSQSSHGKGSLDDDASDCGEKQTKRKSREKKKHKKQEKEQEIMNIGAPTNVVHVVHFSTDQCVMGLPLNINPKERGEAS